MVWVRARFRGHLFRFSGFADPSSERDGKFGPGALEFADAAIGRGGGSDLLSFIGSGVE
jgi:hypothetical protein